MPNNGLALGFLALFLGPVALQSISGHALYIVEMVWLLQRGSPESKPVGAAHSVTGVEG